VHSNSATRFGREHAEFSGTDLDSRKEFVRDIGNCLYIFGGVASIAQFRLQALAFELRRAATADHSNAKSDGFPRPRLFFSAALREFLVLKIVSRKGAGSAEEEESPNMRVSSVFLGRFTGKQIRASRNDFNVCPTKSRA
jgi:hypothetical protein